MTDNAVRIIRKKRRRIDESIMGEIHQYQHQHQPPQQSQPQPQPQPQPRPLFEQRQQQRLMTEQLANFPLLNHFNLQYNYNNNYHQQQQQQQIFQPLQNLQTNHHGIFPSHQHFYPQQYLEQQQRRLQQENNHYHHYHHYQQPSCSRDNNNNNHNNNFRGFITGGGSSSSVIPIPSIPLDLNGNGRCRNDNDVTASRFTSLARPSHFCMTLNTDICGDRRNKSGDYINEADENDKHREYHNHNHQPEMNQNYGYDDPDRQETSKSCGRYFSELEEALCGHTSSSSPAAIVSLPPPPVSDELTINHLNAKKAGKQVVKEEVEQEMQPSPSTMADHDHHHQDHDMKRKKRIRERDEEMEWMEKLIQALVNQLVESMEACFTKFLGKIEKMDKERKEREETWRRRGMENLQLKFSVPSKSHIENRTLPTIAPPTTTTTDDPSIVAQTIPTERIILNGKGSSSKRWPEEEVDALIQLRRSLEERFQEPGLKWPLWQEISNRMSSMGFHQRDAKKCKEKWENIIKYFKKLQQQDGRRQKLKTCVYFDKLDQFYNSNSSTIDNGGCYGGGGGNIDLQQIQREEISVKKTDVGFLQEEEEEYDDEVEWNEFDSRF